MSREGDGSGEPGEGDGSGEPGEPDDDYGEYADESAPESIVDDESLEYDEALEYDEDYESGETTEPPRARRWPRVLIAGGFVVLAAAIVGGAIAIVGSLTHGFKKPVKVTYKKSAVFSLKAGECIDPKGPQTNPLSPATRRTTRRCSPRSGCRDRRGREPRRSRRASSGCASRLSGYLNPQLAISLTSTYVYPDSVAWQAGTRTVICEVRATNGQLTGSVRGASASSG